MDSSSVIKKWELQHCRIYTICDVSVYWLQWLRKQPLREIICVAGSLVGTTNSKTWAPCLKSARGNRQENATIILTLSFFHSDDCKTVLRFRLLFHSWLSVKILIEQQYIWSMCCGHLFFCVYEIFSPCCPHFCVRIFFIKLIFVSLCFGR